MVPPVTLRTDRLTLRPWQNSDRAPFAALSADPEVMAFLRPLETPERIDAWIGRQRDHFARHGFGFWAVERTDQPGLIGAIGLMHVPYEAHFTPAVEVGWRLARSAWGQGYAVEAAAASVAFGFDGLGLEEIVANASPANARSRAVMHRLGMDHRPEDGFLHPALAPDDPLRQQVLYRLSRATWRSGTNPAARPG